MDSLFLKFADDSEVGYDMSLDLGDDPDFWIDEILNYVASEHAYLARALAAPVFEHFDEDKRDAIGHIVARSDGTVLQLPIIIKDGKLFPVDVYIHKGKAHPLTEARVLRVFFTPEVADAVADGEDTVSRRETDGVGGRVDNLQDWMGWKQAMPAGADESIGEMGEYLDQHPEVLKKLAKDCPELLMGAFEERLVPAGEQAKVAAAQIERTGPGRYKVAVWKPGQAVEVQDMAGATVLEFLKGASVDLAVLEQADEGKTVTVPVQQAKPVFEDDIGQVGKLVDRTGAYTVYTKDFKPHDAYVITDVLGLDGQLMPQNLVLMKGSYAFQEKVVGSDDSSGNGYDALTAATHPKSPFTDSGDYDSQRDIRDYAWEGASVFGRTVCVVIRTDRSPDQDPPEGASSREHREFYEPKRTALEPVDVIRATSIKVRKPGQSCFSQPVSTGEGRKDGADAVRSVFGKTRSGETVTLVFSDNVVEPVEVDRESAPPEVRRVIQAGSKAYIVPDGEIVTLAETSVPLLDSPEMLRDIAKLSSAEHEGVTFVEGYQEGFRISGETVEGIGKCAGGGPLSEAGARLALAAYGCPNEMSDRILEKAASGKATVYGLVAPAELVDHRVQVDEKRARALCKKAQDLRKEGKHLKWAAVIPDTMGALGGNGEEEAAGNGSMPLEMSRMLEGTGPIYGNMADDVAGGILSLGFLQRDNIPFFASRIPQIQETVSIVSQMLLASRANPEVPFLDRSLLREALNHLEDVVEGLDGIAD